MSLHVCKRVTNCTHRHTHRRAKTQESTITRIRGRLIEGPVSSSVVPVVGDLGHTAASSARHTAGKNVGESGKNGKMERWTCAL